MTVVSKKQKRRKKTPSGIRKRSVK
jgi:DNA processing protein